MVDPGLVQQRLAQQRLAQQRLAPQQKRRPRAPVQRVPSTTRSDHVPRFFFFTPLRTKAQLWLMRATNVFPKEQREWGRAVIAELDTITGFWSSMAWIAGGMTAMSKAALRNILLNIVTGAWRKEPGQEPPYAAAAGISFILLLAPFYFVSASLLNQWGITWLFTPIEHWLSRPDRPRLST
jgi:hypothetical protein